MAVLQAGGHEAAGNLDLQVGMSTANGKWMIKYKDSVFFLLALI